MFWKPPPGPATSCPNCGKKEYQNNECRVCGYHRPGSRELEGSARLLECLKCGYSYLDNTDEVIRHEGHPRQIVDPMTGKRSEWPPPPPVLKTYEP